MIIAANIISTLITLGVPIGLWIFFVKRYQLPWWIPGIGILTFIGSQGIHLPLVDGFNSLVSSGSFFKQGDPLYIPAVALVLGLLAGLCEETARWLGYYMIRERGKSWGASLALGAGHGGIESILLAGLTIPISLVTMIVMKNQGVEVFQLDAAAAAQMQTALINYWNADWWMYLLPAWERLCAMTLHISFSVLIWRAVMTRSAWWYVAAVLWHTVVDAVAVSLSSYQWNVLAIEAVVTGMALLSVAMVVWIYRKYVQPPVTATTPA